MSITALSIYDVENIFICACVAFHYISLAFRLHCYYICANLGVC